jgi:hypothetical protein
MRRQRGEAEIADHALTLRIQEEVRRFDVVVNEQQVMRPSHAVARVAYEADDVVHFKSARSRCCQLAFEGAVLSELGHEVRPTGRHVRVPDREYVRVAEATKYVSLPPMPASGRDR